MKLFSLWTTCVIIVFIKTMPFFRERTRSVSIVFFLGFWSLSIGWFLPKTVFVPLDFHLGFLGFNKPKLIDLGRVEAGVGAARRCRCWYAASYSLMAGHGSRPVADGGWHRQGWQDKVGVNEVTVASCGSRSTTTTLRLAPCDRNKWVVAAWWDMEVEATGEGAGSGSG